MVLLEPLDDAPSDGPSRLSAGGVSLSVQVPTSAAPTPRGGVRNFPPVLLKVQSARLPPRTANASASGALPTARTAARPRSMGGLAFSGWPKPDMGSFGNWQKPNIGELTGLALPTPLPRDTAQGFTERLALPAAFASPPPSPRAAPSPRLNTPRLNSMPLRERAITPAALIAGQEPVLGSSLQRQQLTEFQRKQLEYKLLVSDLQQSETRLDMLENESWRVRKGDIYPQNVVAQMSDHIDIEEARHSAERDGLLATNEALKNSGLDLATQVRLLQSELLVADRDVAGLRGELEDFQYKAASEATGVQMDAEQAAEVNAVLDEVFDGMDEQEEIEPNEETQVTEEEEVEVDADDIPGWTLEKWLSGLQFDSIVSGAILRRVHDKVPAGKSVQKYEQSFVTKLGQRASMETVLALLKETPVLTQSAPSLAAYALLPSPRPCSQQPSLQCAICYLVIVAELICSSAVTLQDELEEAREDRRLADLEEAEAEERRKKAEESAKRHHAKWDARNRWNKIRLSSKRGAGAHATVVAASRKLAEAKKKLVEAEQAAEAAKALAHDVEEEKRLLQEQMKQASEVQRAELEAALAKAEQRVQDAMAKAETMKKAADKAQKAADEAAKVAEGAPPPKGKLELSDLSDAVSVEALNEKARRANPSNLLLPLPNPVGPMHEFVCHPAPHTRSSKRLVPSHYRTPRTLPNSGRVSLASPVRRRHSKTGASLIRSSMSTATRPTPRSLLKWEIITRSRFRRRNGYLSLIHLMASTRWVWKSGQERKGSARCHASHIRLHTSGASSMKLARNCGSLAKRACHSLNLQCCDCTQARSTSNTMASVSQLPARLVTTILYSVNTLLLPSTPLSGIACHRSCCERRRLHDPTVQEAMSWQLLPQHAQHPLYCNHQAWQNYDCI